MLYGKVFLPDVNVLKRRECNYQLKVLEQKDFVNLYLPTWENALCKDRKQLDVLGIGAYDNEKLIGLAACSADCDDMWQIGVDVLPDYRRQGIASSLTSNLAIEIIDRGKVPFIVVLGQILNPKKCITQWLCAGMDRDDSKSC